MKKLTTSLILLVATFSLIGCNTIDGVGEDIEQAGENIEEAAE